MANWARNIYFIEMTFAARDYLGFRRCLFGLEELFARTNKPSMEFH